MKLPVILFILARRTPVANQVAGRTIAIAGQVAGKVAKACLLPECGARPGSVTAMSKAAFQQALAQHEQTPAKSESADASIAQLRATGMAGVAAIGAAEPFVGGKMALI